MDGALIKLCAIFFWTTLYMRAAVTSVLQRSVVVCYFQLGPMHNYYCVLVIIGFLLMFFFRVNYRCQITENK